jgi:hypothetical protein
MSSIKKLGVSLSKQNDNIELNDIYSSKYIDNLNRHYQIISDFSVKISEYFIEQELNQLSNMEDILLSEGDYEVKNNKLKKNGILHIIENRINENISWSLALYGRKVQFHMKNMIFHLGKINKTKGNREIYKMYFSDIKKDKDIRFFNYINIWSENLKGKIKPFEVEQKGFLPLTIFNEKGSNISKFRNVKKEVIDEHGNKKLILCDEEEYLTKLFIGDILFSYKLSLNKKTKLDYLQIYSPIQIKFISLYEGDEDIVNETNYDNYMD